MVEWVVDILRKNIDCPNGRESFAYSLNVAYDEYLKLPSDASSIRVLQIFAKKNVDQLQGSKILSPSPTLVCYLGDLCVTFKLHRSIKVLG